MFLGEDRRRWGGVWLFFVFLFGQYLNVYCHDMLYSSSDCLSMCSIAYVMIINVYRGYTESFHILTIEDIQCLV